MQCEAVAGRCSRLPHSSLFSTLRRLPLMPDKEALLLKCHTNLLQGTCVIKNSDVEGHACSLFRSIFLILSHPNAFTPICALQLFSTHHMAAWGWMGLYLWKTHQCSIIWSMRPTAPAPLASSSSPHIPSELQSRAHSATTAPFCFKIMK